MKKLEKAIENASDNNIKAVGFILKQIGTISEKAAEIIEQDLEIETMSLSACYKAIYNYAKENAEGNSFGCAVFGIDINNPVIKVILDFYKIPSEWIGEPKSEPTGFTIESNYNKPKKKSLFDYM